MTQLSNKELEERFYSKPFFLSYSGLNKLLFSPNVFYKHYILEEREERIDSHLIDGKVIHSLLLEDGSFEKDFITIPLSLPSGNTRLVVDKVFEISKTLTEEPPSPDGWALDNLHPQIVDVLKQINLHQSLKTDNQRVEKIISDETRSYWEFLKTRGNKTLVDDETLTRCKESVEALSNNSRVRELIGLNSTEMDNVIIKNELPYQTTNMNSHSFGLKGVMDNVKVDHIMNIIYINDIKTTGKTLSDFPDSVEYYKYWIQAAIYERLVRDYYVDLIEKGYKIEFNFIVIDKYLQVYPFPVSEDTLGSWQVRLEEVLNEAEWHYVNRDYSLPYKFAMNQVIL